MKRHRMVGAWLVALAASGCQDLVSVTSPDDTAASSLVRSSVQSPSTYSVSLLPLPADLTHGDAYATNSRGDVVGIARNGPHAGAVLWPARSRFIDLMRLGGPGTSARAINDKRDVVGTGFPGPAEARAFLWTERDGMRDLLPDVPGGTRARDINNQGLVAGNLGQVTSQPPRAFVWSERDGLTELGNLPGGTSSIARAINNRGEVVGEATAPGPDGLEVHAFLWTRKNGMRDLGRIAPVPIGGNRMGAFDINERGEVVGAHRPLGQQSRPFLWTERTGFVDLNAPNALGGGAALEINDLGEVVGFVNLVNPDSPNNQPVQTPFLWSERDGFVLLPLLHAGRHAIARSINNSGLIAGVSRGPQLGLESYPVVWQK